MSRKETREELQKTEKRRGLLSLAGVLVAVGLSGTCCSYLLCINDLSVRGFELREMKKTRDSLVAENEKFELEATELDSLARIEKDTASRGMVKMDGMEFIAAVEDSFAKR